MKARTAKEFASAVCGNGPCVCGYDCGHSNKIESATLPLVGKETVCPLAKYHVKQDSRTFYERMRAGDVFEITEKDCWNFCAKHCEHAEVSTTNGEATIHLKDFDSACIDCPVQMARESLIEAEGLFS